MRRLFASLTALGLLSAALGCHHIAGRCDCDLPDGYGGPPLAAAVPVPAAHPEMIKEMPKETGRIEPLPK